MGVTAALSAQSSLPTNCNYYNAIPIYTNSLTAISRPVSTEAWSETTAVPAVSIAVWTFRSGQERRATARAIKL